MGTWGNILATYEDSFGEARRLPNYRYAVAVSLYRNIDEHCVVEIEAFGGKWYDNVCPRHISGGSLHRLCEHIFAV